MDKGYVTYAGRTNEGEAKFYSGECAMLIVELGRLREHRPQREVQVGRRAAAVLRRRERRAAEHDHRRRQPVGDVRQDAAPEYKGVAKFFTFLSQPEIQAEWHQDTGYLPITHGRVRADEEVGLLREEPGPEHRRRADDREDDEQLARRAPRQLRAGAHGDRGGARERVGGQEGAEGSARRGGQARQRDHRARSRRRTSDASDAGRRRRLARHARTCRGAPRPLHARRARPRWPPRKRVVFQSKWLPYVLVAPQIVVTVVFFFLPATQALYQSLLVRTRSAPARSSSGSRTSSTCSTTTRT